MWYDQVHCFSMLYISWMCIGFVEKGTPEVTCETWTDLLSRCSNRLFMSHCYEFVDFTKCAKWLNHNICATDLADWNMTQNNILLKVDWPCLTLTALLPEPYPSQVPHTVHRMLLNILTTHLPGFPLDAVVSLSTVWLELTSELIDSHLSRVFLKPFVNTCWQRLRIFLYCHFVLGEWLGEWHAFSQTRHPLKAIITNVFHKCQSEWPQVTNRHKFV